jgi:hypothetical protein
MKILAKYIVYIFMLQKEKFLCSENNNISSKWIKKFETFFLSILLGKIRKKFEETEIAVDCCLTMIYI